jgi:hypothetical protein
MSLQKLAEMTRARILQNRENLTQQYKVWLLKFEKDLATIAHYEAMANEPVPAFDLSFMDYSAEPATHSLAPAPKLTYPVIPPALDQVEDEDEYPNAGPSKADTQALAVSAESEEEDDTDEDDAPTPVKVSPSVVVAKGPVPDSVEIGRGGKPKLTDSMRFVLETYGPLHPADMGSKIQEHGLAPNSRKLVDYIRYNLSKNKGIFCKVPGQRGQWDVVAKRKLSAPVGVAHIAFSGETEVMERPSEILEVEAFRLKEKTGSRMSPEEAMRLVDEMTKPNQAIRSGTSQSSYT